MSKPVSGLNVFQNQAGPIPLSQLDSNFTLHSNALNDIGTYSNYFVDASGAANTITVTVAAPLTFAYVTGIQLQVKLANTNTSGTVNVNVNALGNKTLINNDGSNPAIGSLVANSILEVMYDGVSFRLLRQSGTTFITTGLFGAGSAAAPSISTIGDTDTGFYFPAANQIGVAVAGGNVVTISTLAFAFGTGVQIQAADGTVSLPGWAFNSDSDTGAYRIGNNTLGFATGGTFAGAFNSSQQLLLIDGAAGTPSWTFNSDPDTGGYREAANTLAFAAGGTRILTVTTSGVVVRTGTLQLQDGSAGAPALAFDADSDTGIHRNGTNIIGFDAGGTLVATFTLGDYSFSGLAGSTARLSVGSVNTGFLEIGDNITAPGVGGSNRARIYVDGADGDLKIIFSDGTIKTIVTDT